MIAKLKVTDRTEFICSIVYAVRVRKRSTKGCACVSAVVAKYQKRISGPLLDRIDIHIEVLRVDYEKLSDDRLGETSASIRQHVQTTRDIQNKRFADGNHQISYVMLICVSGRSDNFASFRTKVTARSWTWILLKISGCRDRPSGYAFQSCGSHLRAEARPNIASIKY